LEISMKGRKPLPQPLHAARGTKARIGHNRAVRVTSQLLAPPETLTDAARAEWLRVAPLLHEAGIGCDLDEAVIAGYCENRVIAIEAAHRFATEGGVVDGKRSHWIGIGNAAWDQVRRFGDQLGLSPQSRLRVVPADPAPEPSPWDEFD
jgi:P27 family predicted phage terminase small subunit